MPELDIVRPLVAVDLETTGLSIANDRVVEVGLATVLPDGSRKTRSWRVNPGRPIPAAASRIHGISDADVASCPTFADLAAELAAALAGVDLAGYNIERFDLPVLAAEFRRVGIQFPDPTAMVLDAYTIFVRRHPRDLAAALQTYCGRELAGAHSAEADAVAALDVLLAQVARHDDVAATVPAWAAHCRRAQGQRLDVAGKIIVHEGAAALSFGRHRLRPLAALARDEPGYLRWVLTQDFPDDTLALVRGALAGAEQPAAARP